MAGEFFRIWPEKPARRRISFTSKFKTMEEQKTPATPNATLVAIATAPVLSKEAATASANELLARVHDKQLDLLDVWARMVYFQKVAEAFMSDTTKAEMAKTIAERSAGTGKVIEAAGTFATRAVASTYTYDHDAQWVDITNALETLKELKSKREQYLKALPGQTEETYRGEKVNIFPATKVSRDGFAFSLNK